jgi:hypothetical protein
MTSDGSRDPDRPASRTGSVIVGALGGGLLGLLVATAAGLASWLTLCVWDSVEDGRMTWADPPVAFIVVIGAPTVLGLAIGGAVWGGQGGFARSSPKREPAEHQPRKSEP